MPSGRNLTSAHDLNGRLHQVPNEKQMIRVADYLGKQHVANDFRVELTPSTPFATMSFAHSDLDDRIHEESEV
jgi:glucose-6-phosphate 1-dehydrogenase